MVVLMGVTTNGVQRCILSHLLRILAIFRPFDNSHPIKCKIKSHCGFHLHFSTLMFVILFLLITFGLVCSSFLKMS